MPLASGNSVTALKLAASTRALPMPMCPRLAIHRPAAIATATGSGSSAIGTRHAAAKVSNFAATSSATVNALATPMTVNARAMSAFDSRRAERLAGWVRVSSVGRSAPAPTDGSARGICGAS